MGIEPTTNRCFSYTLCPCAGLKGKGGKEKKIFYSPEWDRTHNRHVYSHTLDFPCFVVDNVNNLLTICTCCKSQVSTICIWDLADIVEKTCLNSFDLSLTIGDNSFYCKVIFSARQNY